MYYESFEESIKTNTKEAREIIDTRLTGDEKETLLDTLDFLEYELIEKHKIIGWMEIAESEVCSTKKRAKMLKIFSALMHNDFVTNTEFGKEMVEKGLMKPKSFKFKTILKKSENDDKKE